MIIRHPTKSSDMCRMSCQGNLAEASHIELLNKTSVFVSCGILLFSKSIATMQQGCLHQETLTYCCHGSVVHAMPRFSGCASFMHIRIAHLFLYLLIIFSDVKINMIFESFARCDVRQQKYTSKQALVSSLTSQHQHNQTLSGTKLNRPNSTSGAKMNQPTFIAEAKLNRPNSIYRYMYKSNHTPIPVNIHDKTHVDAYKHTLLA